LIVHGLLIEGKVSVLEGNLGSLQVAHCTLAPGEGGLVVNASSSDINKQNSQLSISLQGCIGGPVLLPESVSNLRVRDSLLSSGWNSVNDAVAIHAPGADTDLRQSTIFGSSAVRSLEASNSIFTGTVNAARCQIGRVCFCYLPVASRVPRRYRCQPSSEEDAVRIEPQFTSRRYGDPGYGQLSQRCPLQIRRGAEDESEMGAFHDLFQHQREANLRIRLNEYLRFGLEAGIYRVT
jgi:hypothetical protein